MVRSGSTCITCQGVFTPMAWGRLSWPERVANGYLQDRPRKTPALAALAHMALAPRSVKKVRWQPKDETDSWGLRLGHGDGTGVSPERHRVVDHNFRCRCSDGFLMFPPSKYSFGDKYAPYSCLPHNQDQIFQILAVNCLFAAACCCVAQKLKHEQPQVDPPISRIF